MATVQALAHRLEKASSRPGRDPYAAIEWPASRDAGAWYFSPELVSLHGTPAWEALDEEARRSLAFFEAVNFFSLNVHGETRLIAGLDASPAARGDAPVARYLRCFRAEEARHRDAFARFCTDYAGGVYPDRSIALAPAWAGEDAELVFFARVLVFEEFVDGYNTTMARDPRLAAVARQINRAHHLEESRHLAFGRAWLARLVQAGRARWRHGEGDAIAADLADFRRALWLDLFSARAWRDAGLTDTYALRVATLADPAVRARERAQYGQLDRSLRAAGIGIGVGGADA